CCSTPTGAAVTSWRCSIRTSCTAAKWWASAASRPSQIQPKTPTSTCSPSPEPSGGDEMKRVTNNWQRPLGAGLLCLLGTACSASAAPVLVTDCNAAEGY